MLDNWIPCTFTELLITNPPLFECSWVNDQELGEVWTEGVEDYLTYAKRLVKDYEDVIGTEENTIGNSNDSKPTVAAPLFNFSASAAAPAAPAAAPGFFAFGGFGSQPAPAFGAAGATSAATVEEEDDNEAEEDDGGPSLELESADATILHSLRVTLLTNNPETKKWADRGVGTLTMRQSKEGGRLPYVMFTTDAGRVLINAPLVKGMKPMMNPKAPKNVIMLLISKISADSDEDRSMQLFKCATPEAAKDLMARLMEYVE